MKKTGGLQELTWCLTTGTTWIYGVITEQADAQGTGYRLAFTEPLTINPEFGHQNWERLEDIVNAVAFWVSVNKNIKSMLASNIMHMKCMFPPEDVLNALSVR